MLQKVRRNRQLSPGDLAELERMLDECGDAEEIAEARRWCDGAGPALPTRAGVLWSLSLNLLHYSYASYSATRQCCTQRPHAMNR